MDYQNDTLTNAIRNRAASRKLFEHWNANPQPLGCPSTTRMASLTASNPSNFASQHNRHFALPQDAQPSPPSQPMTTNLTNGAAAAATSFESNGVVGQQQQPNILLHRSPSGAQRKIRQKAQQQQQNGIGGFGGSNNAQQQQQMAYRNLIRENGYRSILGDEGANRTADPSAPRSLDPALSVGQLIDRMNRLEPFPKSIDSSWLQSAGGSIDKMPSMASQLDGQPSSAFPLSSKPTVQVHPLPVPPRHRSMSVISSCSSPSQKPIPPPLPPKKHSLMASQFGIPNKRNIQTNPQNHEESTQILSGPHWQSSVLSSSQSSFSHSQSSSAETEFPGFHSSKQQLTDEKDNPSQHFVEEVGDKKGRSQSIGQKPIAEPRKEDGRRIGPKQPNHFEHKIANPSPFFSPPPSLSSSPSLASLQNSLHFAIENPEKHSWEQLQELDQRRLQSIDSLGKKVAEREQDRQLLCRDLEEIGQLKTVLFARISQNRHNSDLLNRLDIFLAEMEKMTDLETYLHCQLARLRETNKLAKKEELENGWIEGERAEWVKRLREQINDLHFLGGVLASRERHLDAEMAEELGDAEALNEWIFYKEQLGKLSAEKRQLEERLRDVRNLIDSLQAICLCPQKLD